MIKMKTIKVIATITYDDSIMCDEYDPKQVEWLKDILFGDDNIIHNNEIGDTFGNIKIVEILESQI